MGDRRSLCWFVVGKPEGKITIGDPGIVGR